MSHIIFAYAASRYFHDQFLAEAARVALEANPIPRMVKIMVDQDGTPIEIPQVVPLSESSPPPWEAEE